MVEAVFLVPDRGEVESAFVIDVDAVSGVAVTDKLGKIINLLLCRRRLPPGM